MITDMKSVKTNTAPNILKETKKKALPGDASIKGFSSGPTIAIALVNTFIHPSWETISKRLASD
jgi:hypothetical protein